MTKFNGEIIEGLCDMDLVYFGKLRESVIIPSKREEDGGWDIYANFEEDSLIIPPNSTVFVPTGLVSAFSDKYVVVLKERGSTGKLHIGQGCGVVDSGYRGEWNIPLRNHNSKKVVISKEHTEVKETLVTIYYPYTKALCQALFIPVPKITVQELEADTIKNIPSERGEGKTGSSGK